jgi:hypothetical protein
MRLLAAALLVLAPACAHAAPEEIQVYMDEMGKPGDAGLDVHVNYAADGRTGATYPGEMASGGRWRITPEWSYAVLPELELGLYLPLATIDRDGRAELGGVKGRLKFIAPRKPDQPWFWGANFEIGRVRHDLDVNPWNAELKGIAGYRTGPWTLAANLNIDWAVSGPAKPPTSFQLATKVSYQVGDKTALGLESYNDLGDTHGWTPVARGDQQIYAVMDRSFGDWDLDLGVGYGYGQPEDRWIVKAIVGVPIGK